MNNLLLLILFSLQLSFLQTASAQEVWDWHITGGVVVDGTGAERYRADILVRADTIAYIGSVDSDTIAVKNRVDASGRIVAPGFIDVHAHGDPLKTPRFRNFLSMGVTTIVLGQDGSSPAEESLADWFDEVERVRPAVNIAALTGHASARRRGGVADGPATPDELRQMTRLVEQDLEDGAFGMSTGLEYLPGKYADSNELQRLAETVGRYDAVIMSHMRSEDNSEIEASLDELAEQGRFADIHVSHLKVVYGEGAGRANEILNYMDGFRDRGINITADVYPYTASYTGIGILFPEWSKTTAGWQQAMARRPEDLRFSLEEKVKQRNGAGAILFGSGKYSGSTLREAAESEGKSPVELLMEMGPRAASAAHFVMDEELQNQILLGEKVMISSDGSPTMWHPRGYGSFAKVIRKYVCDQKLLSLEIAVYKMSGLPTEMLQLPDRGTIQTGMKADLLIFDPVKIEDRATFEKPHQPAEGFDWIMINGQIVRDKGVFREGRFGSILKKDFF